MAKTWTEVNKYIVRRLGGEYSCTCKGFFYTGACKHITIAKEILDDNETLQSNSQDIIDNETGTGKS